MEPNFARFYLQQLQHRDAVEKKPFDQIYQDFAKYSEAMSKMQAKMHSMKLV
jgi:hypothetical protein